GLETDREDVVYVGDKAINDGRGGRDAGIGTICLLRGGKDSDETLEAALTSGDADHVLDSPDQVIDVLAALLPARARSSPLFPHRPSAAAPRPGPDRRRRPAPPQSPLSPPSAP